MARTRNLGTLTNLLTAGTTYVAATTPAWKDNSTNLATTAFVKTSGIQAASVVIVSTTQTLAYTSIGSTVQVLGNTGPITLTLPPVSSSASGYRIEIVNSSTYPVTILASGSNTLIPSIGGSAYASGCILLGGDFVTFESPIQGSETTVWVAVGGSSQLATTLSFANVLSSNGYQRLPTGCILQWGSAVSNSSGIATLSLPVTFPTALLNAQAGYVINGTGVATTVANISNTSTLSQLVAVVQSGGTALNAAQVYFQAIGY